MKTKLAQIITGLLLFFIFLVLPRTAYAASSLTASPTSTTLANGASTTITVSINADSAARGADTVINLNSGDLSVSNVAGGGYFPEFSYSVDTSNNLLYVYSYYAPGTFGSKTGSGTLATFTIQAKKDSGTSTISFVCSGNNPSDILNSNGDNILSCSTNPATITFTGSTAPTNTPTPTPTITPTPLPTATPTPQPTATPAPANGNTAPTCTGLSVSSNKGTPTLWSTFNCSGYAKNADITAAEFVFGDGKVQLVEKNTGNSGFISVLHPYTSIGSYVATCRVRDNNQLFSNNNDSCRKTITVTKTSAAVNLTRGTTNNTVTLAAATTPQVIQLTPYILPPSPTAIPTIAPVSEQPKSGNLLKTILSIVGVAVVLGLIYFVMKKHKSNNNQPVLPPSEPFQPPTQQ